MISFIKISIRILMVVFMCLIMPSVSEAQIAGKDTIPEIDVPKNYKTKLLEGLRAVTYGFWFKANESYYGLEYLDSTGTTYVRVISLLKGETRAKTYTVVDYDKVPTDLKSKLQFMYGADASINRVYYNKGRYIFEVKNVFGVRLVELI